MINILHTFYSINTGHTIFGNYFCYSSLIVQSTLPYIYYALVPMCLWLKALRKTYKDAKISEFGDTGLSWQNHNLKAFYLKPFFLYNYISPRPHDRCERPVFFHRPGSLIADEIIDGVNKCYFYTVTSSLAWVQTYGQLQDLAIFVWVAVWVLRKVIVYYSRVLYVSVWKSIMSNQYFLFWSITWWTSNKLIFSL